MPKEDLFKKLAEAIINGDEKGAVQEAKDILEAGVDPMEAIRQGAAKGLEEVGERFQRLEAFLPELMMAGEAMRACLEVLLPVISAERKGAFDLGRVVIGTVSGDIHDIGKNMVASILRINGFEVYDIGIDVSVKRFIEKAEEVKAKIIALSALLTTSANYQREVIRYLKDAGLREKYYIAVGGAPTNEVWAAEIGADAYAKDAFGASQVLKKLVVEGVPPPLPRPLVII
jgi:corrinoid protein of di/trimethylamine methyltransferase